MSEQFLRGHTLTPEQQAAAKIMDGAVDSIIAAEYGEPCIAEERVRLGSVALSSYQVQTIQKLSDEGQAFMTRRYGAVYPDFQAGYEAHLGYQNGDHTRMFAENAARLSTELELSPALAVITDKIVPPWHDADQTNVIRGLPRLGQDEQSSAELLVKNMRLRGLPKHMAEIAAIGILGTWVVIDARGLIVGQWGALPHDYPSKDSEIAAKSAATADLAGLYQPRGPYNSHLLYAQRRGKTPGETPPLDGFGKFLTNQAVLLEEHRFPIEEANRLPAFVELKGEVINYNQKVLRQFRDGIIGDPTTFWPNLLRQDLEFMHEHS